MRGTWRESSFTGDPERYRVIQEESAVLWEMIVCLILSKKVHMNIGPILNGYRDNGKKKIRTILRARTAIT